MSKNYYVHLTSWSNEEGETYDYDNQPVGVFKYSQNIDELFETFMKQETYLGFSPKSEGLFKVTEQSLNEFRQHVFNYEIGATLTYNLHNMLDLASETLKGYDQRLRYRRSIHYCESVLSGIAMLDSQVEELKEYMDIIENQKDEVLEYLSENQDCEESIVELSGANTIQRKAEEAYSVATSKREELEESRQTVINRKARDLEDILGMGGYKAPILNFNAKDFL